MALAGTALLYIYGSNPEKLKDLLPFVSFGAEVISILRGSVVFVLKVSSISSLKRLWQSYKNGSLKEKLKKSFNEVKELKEVSQGEEIDVEVTIDEEEYREVLFDLILFVVKGNSTKNTNRQRRHSICCEREERNKPMDVTQIQIRVGSPITELEKSIDSIKRLKKRLAKGLSRVAEFEEERLSEIRRQLSEMEIFLAAAGFSEIRLKQAEKTRLNENVERNIPLMKRESSTESGIVKSLSEHEKGTDTLPSLVNTALTEADATEISSIIGREWRALGRNLKFPETTLESISNDKSNHSYAGKAHALLIKFIRQQGCDATKGKLAEALFRIERRDIAEILIGTQHFASKTPDQQMFFLREEVSFDVPDEDGQPVSFFACRNIDNGRLYLVRELVGTGYEESCKTLKQQDTIADSILKTIDMKGIVKAEKQKKEKQRFKEAQDEIVELVKGLQEIVNSLENQERKENIIHVWQQLLEDEALLGEMQRLVTGLLQLTGRVSHFEDPFPLQAQMYSFSLGLSAILRNLEERIRMLREMVPSAKKLLGKIETEKFDELLNWSRRLGKEIKMRENVLIRHFKGAAPLQNQQRPRHGEHCSASDPPPKTSSYPVDITEIRRAGTQPVSQDEFRTLAEQVAPAPDPLEQEEGSFC